MLSRDSKSRTRKVACLPHSKMEPEIPLKIPSKNELKSEDILETARKFIAAKKYLLYRITLFEVIPKDMDRQFHI